MTMFKKIAYNCRHATFLIEKKQITSLTIRESFELKIHMAGCSVCRLFEKQSININRMVKHLLQPFSNNTFTLDKDFKERMQNKIDQKINPKTD